MKVPINLIKMFILLNMHLLFFILITEQRSVARNVWKATENYYYHNLKVYHSAFLSLMSTATDSFELMHTQCHIKCTFQGETDP